MLTIFKSHASADVIMFGPDARRLLEILGKEPEPRGILTVEQLPESIARLEAAAAEDRAQVRALRDRLDAENDFDAIAGEKATVHLSQRALPLILMMKESLKEEAPVVWGV